MKKVVFLMLLLCSSIAGAQSHDASYFYTAGVNYTYSPAGCLSITKEGDTDTRKVTFTYSGSNIKNYGRGYAYLVLSKSASLNNMSNCYMYNLGRFYRNDSSNPNHAVFSNWISIASTPCYKITQISDRGGFTQTSTKLPKNGRYYHYIVLFVNTGTKLENIVITEPRLSRTTIDYLYKPDSGGGTGEEPAKKNYDIELKNIKHYGGVYNASNYVNVELQVKNVGDVDAENIDCQFFVADKNQYKNNYKKVACSNNNSMKISKLSIGQEGTFYFNVLLPMESPLDFQFSNNTALFLLGYIQGLVNEKNTDNNSGSTPITIIH